MSKKIKVAAIIGFLMAVILTANVYAGSMLTSPPVDTGDGLAVIGEKTEEVPGNTDEGAMFIPLKKSIEKIWGADVVKEKMKKDETVIEENADCANLPKIMVRTGSPSYRYRHRYSSRHKGGSAVAAATHINITPIIVREAKKNNIHPLLLKGVIQTESGFNTFATSPAGAMGLCQLMPGTASYLGVGNPYDPEASIKGGAKYLGTLRRMFKSTDLVLAAYNAGPGAVSRYGGVPNYYETRMYIQRVKSHMKW